MHSNLSGSTKAVCNREVLAIGGEFVIRAFRVYTYIWSKNDYNAVKLHSKTYTYIMTT